MELQRILSLVLAVLASPRNKRDFKAFSLISLLFFIATAVRPFEGSPEKIPPPSDKIIKNELTFSKRLGYAILLKAGYLEAEKKEQKVEEGEEAHPSPWDFKPSIHPDYECLASTPPIITNAAEGLDVRGVAISILAAEKYNRGDLHRRVEESLARIILGVGGKLPDFSYGLAQVKPNIARQILMSELSQSEIDDAFLFEVITDDCQNIRIASKHISALLESLSVDEPEVQNLIEKVSLEYNGATIETISGLRYVDAVQGAYEILNPNPTGSASKLIDELNIVSLLCLSFPSGSAIPDGKQLAQFSSEAEDMANSLKGLIGITVFLPQVQSGPSAYSQILSQRRQAWISSRLTKLGFLSRTNQLSFYQKSEYSIPDLSEDCSSNSAILVFSGELDRTIELNSEDVLETDDDPVTNDDPVTDDDPVTNDDPVTDDESETDDDPVDDLEVWFQG